MKDTSYTVKGRSSTSASPSSTSLRSVSGCRRCWRRTSRTRTRTTAKPSPRLWAAPQPAATAQYATDVSNPIDPLRHLLSNRVSAPLWHRSTCMCKRGFGLHSTPSASHPLLKRKNQPERLKQISDMNSPYLLSAIGLYGLALPLVDK